MKNAAQLCALLVAGLVLLAPGCGKPGKPGRRVVSEIRKDYAAQLAKVGLKPDQLRVYSLGQSHIDAAWRWRWSH